MDLRIRLAYVNQFAKKIPPKIEKVDHGDGGKRSEGYEDKRPWNDSLLNLDLDFL